MQKLRINALYGGRIVTYCCHLHDFLCFCLLNIFDIVSKAHLVTRHPIFHFVIFIAQLGERISEERIMISNFFSFFHLP